METALGFESCSESNFAYSSPKEDAHSWFCFIKFYSKYLGLVMSLHSFEVNKSKQQ